MTEALAPTAAVVIDPARSPVSLFRRLVRNPFGLVPGVFLLIVGVLAVIGPLLAPFRPNPPELDYILAEPSAARPLGADSAGRDVLSRILEATQISIAAALVAVIVAVLLGVIGGLIAGYFGGWFDSVASWLSGMVMALPSIIILLAARAVFGPSVWLSMAIFGVLLAPSFYMLVYAAVKAVRSELYVDAARVAGLTDLRIIARHILSVVRAPIIIQAAMIAGIAIAIQSGLEFVGLGDVNVPTWGSMLNDGFTNIYRAPMLMLWPSLAIGVTCIALTLLANALRDALDDPATGGRRRGAKVEVVSAPSVAPLRHDDDITAPVLLTVSHLRVGYDLAAEAREVVHGVSLAVHRGEVHGLIGESGSGKSQIAFSILGLLPRGGRVLDGSIRFEGDELTTLSDRQYAAVRGRRIAYIPQEPMSNLDPSFTIGSQLTTPLRVTMGMSRRAAQERILALLARVGIPDPARTFAAYPHQVSGGMAQRVLIAGAISTDPDLIVADEPTTALDVEVQAEILDLLRDLQRERGMSLLIVTHNFGVVADLCDHVSVMKDGSIVESGPVRAIFSAPLHPYTRGLLDAILEDGPVRAPLHPTRTMEVTR
jgi:peptide/nickel transport system permease protein